MAWWQMWPTPYSCFLSQSEQVAAAYPSVPAGKLSLHTTLPFSKIFGFMSEPVSVPLHTMAKKNSLEVPLFHCASQISSVPDVALTEMHQALA